MRAREGCGRGAGPKHSFPQASTRTPPSSPTSGGGSAGDSLWSAGSNLVLCRHPPMPRTVGISPGEGPGREPPPRRQKPHWPFPWLPRRNGGYRDESPGRPTQGAGPDPVLRRRHPVHRTVGISPGEGPGREPPPRQEEPYRPFPRLPRRSGGYRDESPGGAQARGAGPKHSFPQASTRTPPSSLPHPPALRAPPPPQAGAVQVISPERPARGGNPLPVDKNHTGPSPGFPPRSGGSRGESPERPQAWGGNPMHRSPLSPTPPGAGISPHR